MGRIIAVDYGLKRCGLAETDDNKIIASPLTTVSPGELISYLEKYILKHPVETIVIGEPKNLDGSDTDSSSMIRNFRQQLQVKFPAVKIAMVDERFTSAMAANSLIESGAKKKTRRDKSVTDQISAVFILQSYLERKI